MSVCVMVRTDKAIEPNDFLRYLANNGEQIVVTSDEFPYVKFGNHNKAIRGVEVNQEDNGYEVRVCSYASIADYELFAKTIDAISQLTGGKAYHEDCDDEYIDCPFKVFDADWIEKQREASFMTVRAFTKYSGSPVVLFGLIERICIGAKMYNGFEIPLVSEYKKEYMDSLQDYLCDVQWHLADLKNTSTGLVLPSDDGDGNDLTISMIKIADGKVLDFDYISEASLFCIMDMDNQDNIPAFLPFKELWKILPEDTFRIIDEWQFERIGEVTVDMVHQMMETARRFQTDDYHYRPTEPGHGYDNRQNTFILMWNPAFSSVKIEDHNNSIENMLTETFNWSVWEHEKAKVGDRFFLLRVGEGNTGIVMSGVFSSNPYEDDDWSGKGRQTFYMDMVPNVILNPDKSPMVTTQQLTEAIPSFDWSGGHSGRMLSSEEAQAIEKIWEDFMKNNAKSIDRVDMNAINVN